MSLGLQLDGLWASPLADADVIRFERAWADELVTRRTPGPGETRREAFWALKADLKRAWSLGDLKTVAGLGMILHRARTLNDGNRAQLAEALLWQGRFSETREVLADSAQDDHDHWLLTARVQAALGDFDQARTSLLRAEGTLSPIPADQAAAVIRDLGMRRTALDLALGSLDLRREARQHLEAGRPERAADLLTSLSERRLAMLGRMLAVVQRPSAGEEWGAFGDRLASLLILGRPEQATDTLVSGQVVPGPIPAAELGRALRIARAVAAAASGDRQGAILRVVRGLSGDDVDGAFLASALRVLEEHGPWTELTAADPGPRADLQLLVATALARAGQLAPAISLFGRFTLDHDDRQSVRRELVVCCGQESLGRLRLEPRPRAGPPRIIDIFPYNGELEVLKLKLHEMGPWVDHFVIYESNQTYTGRPKPIFLPGQRAEIAEFLPKITHMVTSDAPPHAASAWAREYHQRDESVTALQGLCAPDDLVLLTDADEIVDHRRLEGFAGEFAVLEKIQHRYFFNYRWVAATWRQSANMVLLRARYLKDMSYSVARFLLPAPLGPNRIERAGWHFTSVGDASFVSRKLGSYSHEENVRSDDEEAHLAGLLAEIRAGRWQPGWRRCGLEDLPAYVRDNQERLAARIL